MQEVNFVLQQIGRRDGSAGLFSSHILPNILLLHKVLDNASPGTLLNLSKTCRYAYNAVQEYMSKVYNINKALRRFFEDPLAFRSMQAITSTLVSGSFALQFLGRLYYPESDLDLYCNYDMRKKVGNWIINQGYTFDPWPWEPEETTFDEAANHSAAPLTIGEYSRLHTICAIYNFKKPNPSHPEEELKVQVIVACSTPMEVVLQFHSSASIGPTLITMAINYWFLACVMNVIAYDCAYSLYPRATFEERISMYCASGRPTERDAAAMGKYQARGFRIIYKWPDSRYDQNVVPITTRWIDDRYTWTMPLPLDGVTTPRPFNLISSAFSTDPCYFTTWKLSRRYSVRYERAKSGWGRTEIRTPQPGVCIECDAWSMNGLAYNYVIPAEDEETAKWLKEKAREVCRSHLARGQTAEWDREMWEPDVRPLK